MDAKVFYGKGIIGKTTPKNSKTEPHLSGVLGKEEFVSAIPESRMADDKNRG
jgi:hypothetical protein